MSRKTRTYGDLVVPARGAYFGADDGERFGKPNSFENQLGRTAAIRNHHGAAGHSGWAIFTVSGVQDALGVMLHNDVAAGAHPMVSIGGQGWPLDGLDQIASGKIDGQLQRLAGILNGVGAPVFVRPMMEFNGKHNAGYFGRPDVFKAAWARLRTILPGVFIVCPQQDTSSGSPDWTEYVPPNKQFDIGGMDLYRHHPEISTPFNQFFRARGKQFGIWESGFQQGSVVRDSTGKKWDKDGTVTGNSLILETLAWVKAHPNYIAYVVWNLTGPIGDDHIDTSDESLAQYQVMADDLWMQMK